MKRKIFVLSLLLVLLAALLVPAAAETLDNVTDVAGLLTADQQNALERRAEEISQTYELGVYVIAVDDFTRYSKKPEIYDAQVELFDRYGLGLGEDRAAAVFFISMETREFVFDFNGERAQYAFTESRDLMEDRVLPYLRDNDWYGAFNEFLNVCQEDLEAAQAGTPVGYGEVSRNDSQEGGFSILFFVPGVLAAAVTGVVLVAPMRSAREKHQADDYAVPGSMQLTRKSDHFLRRTVTRTPRPKENSSSSSGGSVSHSHSSGSHSGRSGRF